jgi:hypothetical protein
MGDKHKNQTLFPNGNKFMRAKDGESRRDENEFSLVKVVV